MKHYTTIAAAAAFLCLAAPAAAQTGGRGPQTDQTVPVTRGTRLSISNFAGEIVVRGWDRDVVRVQARHSSRVKVNIRTNAAGLAITGNSAMGSIDYEISAPVWMPLRIDGQFTYIEIQGLQSEISAESVRGDIVVKGGSGTVTAKSIQGEVTIEGVNGRINASSVNEGVRIAGAKGDIVAETTNGSISLTGITDAKSVECSTVNGDIVYDGAIADGGRYRIVTHNGDITLGIPATSNATFSVRTYNGDFSPSLPVKGTGEPRRGRRVAYVLGTGAAEVEVESFGGTIRLRGPGVSGPSRTKDKDKDEAPDR